MREGCASGRRHATAISTCAVFSWFAVFAIVPAGLAQTADLSITKSVSSSAAQIASPWTYTLAAKNNGPSDDTNVAVADSIPFGTTLQSAAASQYRQLETSPRFLKGFFIGRGVA